MSVELPSGYIWMEGTRIVVYAKLLIVDINRKNRRMEELILSR